MTNMKTKNQTFNDFCQYNCDGMYQPLLPYDEQCTGYKQLKKMVEENIEPATMEEIHRWENFPTEEELFSQPDIKYLRFLHTILRPHIIENWNYIKNLEIE